MSLRPYVIAASAAAAAVGVSAYVHHTCVAALGANERDNSVVFSPAAEAADGDSSSQSQTQPGGAPSPSPMPSSSPAPSPTVGPLCPPLPAPLLLVVLGWGGARRSHLRRLVAFCTDTLRCPVVQYTNPMMGFLSPGDDTAVEQLLTVVESQVSVADGKPAKTGGFVVIAHSNNGSHVLAAMKSLMAPSGRFAHLAPKLRGVLFDSAPALWKRPAGSNPISRLRAALRNAAGFSFPSVAIILGRPQYTHLFWTPAATLWVICFKILQALRRLLVRLSGRPAPKEEDVRANMKQALEADIPAVPHLFLFSSGDRLLPSRLIGRFLRAKGEARSCKERNDDRISCGCCPSQTSTSRTCARLLQQSRSQRMTSSPQGTCSTFSNSQNCTPISYASFSSSACSIDRLNPRILTLYIQHSKSHFLTSKTSWHHTAEQCTCTCNRMASAEILSCLSRLHVSNSLSSLSTVITVTYRFTMLSTQCTLLTSRVANLVSRVPRFQGTIAGSGLLRAEFSMWLSPISGIRSPLRSPFALRCPFARNSRHLFHLGSTVPVSPPYTPVLHHSRSHRRRFSPCPPRSCVSRSVRLNFFVSTVHR